MAKCTGMRCPMPAGYKVDECNHKDCHYRTEPMTNADKIWAMSDEELANLLTDFSNNGGWVTEIGREICYKRITDWLKQPAEEEER